MIVETSGYRKMERTGVAPTERTAYHVNPEAASHIAKMLRNLYSRPVEAVVREYVMNSVDAHVLVGKPISDIKIALPTTEIPMFEVRDFGPGLSKKDTRQLLLGFGASGGGKRETNTMIGGWGIGCKSGFAVSDSFFYRVWFDGMLCVYRCFLDEADAGWAELVEEIPTDEPAGISIQIPVKAGQEAEYVKAYGRVAWQLEPAPQVIRGLGALNDWSFDITGDTWDGHRAYFAKHPEFWNDTFSINGVDVKWTWVPKDSVLQQSHAAGTGAHLWVRIGYQLYPIVISQINKDHFQGEAKTFVDEFVNSKRGTWVFEAPIGTLPLSPTREDLQYSAQAQKMLVGMLLALSASWRAKTARLVKDWSDNTVDLESANKLEVSGLGNHLEWILSAAGGKPRSIASWQLKDQPVRCSVVLATRDDLTYDYSETKYKLWSSWVSEAGIKTPIAASASARYMTVYASKSRYANALSDCTITCLDQDWKDEESALLSNRQVLLCPVASGVDTRAAKVGRVFKYLLTLQESLGGGLAQLGFVSEKEAKDCPKTFDRIRRKQRLSKRSRIAGVLFLVDTTKEKLLNDNPWLKGAFVIPFDDIQTAYTKATYRVRLPGASGLPKAKPKPLSQTHYSLRDSNPVIDAEALRNATTRVYVRVCRDQHYAPNRPINMVDEILGMPRTGQQAFNVLAKSLGEPTAYGLCEFHSELMHNPNPNRYGDWTPYHTWFSERLKAKAEEYGVTAEQVGALQASFIVDGVLLVPTQSDAPVPCSLQQDMMEQDIVQLEAWYNWLYANITSAWGRKLLETYNEAYGLANPGAWQMLRILAHANHVCRRPAGLLDNFYADGVNPWADAVKTCGSQWYQWSRGLLKKKMAGGGARRKLVALTVWYSRQFTNMTELSLDTTAHERNWHRKLASWWMVMESAWTTKARPAFPGLPTAK